MGLDMMLYTVSGFEKKDEKEICYWRKANWLHKYFTDVATNADEVEDDNVTPFYIQRADLYRLMDYCVNIVEAYGT